MRRCGWLLRPFARLTVVKGERTAIVKGQANASTAGRDTFDRTPDSGASAAVVDQAPPRD